MSAIARRNNDGIGPRLLKVIGQAHRERLPLDFLFLKIKLLRSTRENSRYGCPANSGNAE